MIKLDTTVIIARPVEQVFRYVADVRNNPFWLPILRVENPGMGRVALGTRFRQWFRWLGEEVEARYEITAFAPPHRVGFKSVARPFSSEGVYRFDEVAEGTRFSVNCALNLHGLLRFGEGMLASQAHGEMLESAQKLKRLLEEQVTPALSAAIVDSGRD